MNSYISIVIAGFTVTILVILMAAGFLKLGARIAGIELRAYWRMIAVTIFGTVAGVVISLVAGSVPVFGALLAYVGNFIAQAVVMMPICQTSFGKALGAVVLASVLSTIILVIIGLAAAIAMPSFMAYAGNV